MDVIAMPVIVGCIPDAVIGGTRLPEGGKSKLRASACGVAAFDVLHRLLQSDVWSWSQYEVNVIRHHDEFVQKKAGLSAIVLQDFNE